MKALQTNKAATFQCSGSTPPSCRSDPASPCHLVRVFWPRWHTQPKLTDANIMNILLHWG